MRVATFNILNGRVPTDQHVDPAGLREAVKRLDADILALQEVDQNQHRSGFSDLTSVAAEAMDAPHHRFVAAIHGSPGATWVAATGDEQPDSAAYGVALLSRYPVKGWQVLRLEPVPFRVPMRFSGRVRPYLVTDEPRVAVLASIETPVGEWTVVGTHLSFIDWWNARQLRKVVRATVDCREPVVLMGDLNIGPERAARVTGMQAAASHPTYPVESAREQIDHILVRGPVRIGETDAPALPISDHRALWAELG
ncbi:endonuclease/exonuclease/phosphatase family protein [Intrasporangium sp.]|uniref:endonuclease/exonuclease/phosphatase family protein n=1 Tax=Intrasporangium sp. TaxID=1925024 RepID=UPI002939DB9F|nr:endonuclease/exonuclease/phosphatase family protein [Intrasporangium sp.]MDV3220863.1 endonuclease/exonuclease/phosphatase family protein [Intrasporangium sp.]